MDKFDEKIIGYEATKNILRQILDTLKRPELYKSKGASIPRGLLMESAPGLGKSLLASVFIKESGRKSLVFRKTSQENSFLDELRAAFLAAKEAAPSILLLEDLNLYVESSSPYAPEWACLQACIDDAKDTDLFVIATTNDTKYMPPSLLRPGRFDYVIYLQPPIGGNAENIVSYYLRDKDLAEDVLISDIVKAMPKVSCATLETVMNLAALNSTYQGHEHIYKDDVTDALLQVVYRLSKTDKSLDLTECQKIALHEAAHAVVGEILNPDSIGIVTIRGDQSCIGGFENGCSTYLKNEEELLNDITKTLAGKVGVSLIYGVMDMLEKILNTFRRSKRSFNLLNIITIDSCLQPFHISSPRLIELLGCLVKCSFRLRPIFIDGFSVLVSNTFFFISIHQLFSDTLFPAAAKKFHNAQSGTNQRTCHNTNRAKEIGKQRNLTTYAKEESPASKSKCCMRMLVNSAGFPQTVISS